MSDTFKIALAQLNLLVGDVHGNATRVITTTRRAARSFEGQCCARLDRQKYGLALMPGIPPVMCSPFAAWA